jgi:flagella basal body P-ring formation protein FlgA
VTLERHLVEGREQPFDGIETVIGLRARRSLATGHLLVEGDLEPVPLVLRNETVRVLLRQGAIEIEMRGEVLADGWLGDRVRVRNPMTRRLMTAVVSGPGEVRLAE